MQQFSCFPLATVDAQPHLECEAYCLLFSLLFSLPVPCPFVCAVDYATEIAFSGSVISGYGCHLVGLWLSLVAFSLVIVLWSNTLNPPSRCARKTIYSSCCHTSFNANRLVWWWQLKAPGAIQQRNSVILRTM